MLSLVASSLALNVQPRVPARAPVVSMAAPLEGTFVYGVPTPLGFGKGPNSMDMVGKIVPTKKVAAVAPAAPVVEAPAPVSKAEVLECQAKWASAIASISSVYLEGGDFVAAAGAAAGELYGYGHHNVLFKPTKATKHPFRATGEVAMSYFVGAEAMDMEEYKGEDAGFAINGGKGWSKVVFTNHQVDLSADTAIAMGSYDFTCATSGDIVTVEYTFGYKRCEEDGKPRIFLHHSSVPYSA